MTSSSGPETGTAVRLVFLASTAFAAAGVAVVACTVWDRMAHPPIHPSKTVGTLRKH